MACTITSGRTVGCKTSNGGIKSVSFADYGTLGALTGEGSGEITAIAGTPTWYQYDVKGTSSLDSAIVSSRENGTTFYEQTLSLVLPVLDKATLAQIQLLAVGRPHIAVEDYNGNTFLVGAEHGADVTGGNIVTGSAMGDMSGFNLTFLASEKYAPQFVVAGLIVADAAKIDPNV